MPATSSSTVRSRASSSACRPRSPTKSFHLQRRRRRRHKGTTRMATTQLNPSEISELIRTRIEKVGLAAEARNEGTVTAVSDGIVRIFGLADVMQGEMIELPNATYAL